MTWNGLWALHTWNLTENAHSGSGSIHATPVLTPAQVECVVDAYASDPIWSDLIGTLRATYPGHLMERTQPGSCSVLGIGPTSDPDGVSVLDPAPNAYQHFVTGICVHPRAQGAGLGRQLLAASLHYLHHLGCPQARAYTRSGSRADHLYASAGSTRECPVAYHSVTAAEATP